MQIKESVTISENVTLVLPYVYNGSTETNTFGADGSASSVYHNSNSSDTKESERNPMKADAMATEDLCSTKVNVCENVTITVKGTMIISGQLDGGGGGTAYAGQTAGYHAKLVLKNDVLITVTSSGALKLLGFIDDESTSTNKAEIEIRGTICQPMVIRDFKGGSITAAAYKGMGNYKYAPFNQFQFNNTDVKVIIHSGSSFYVYANLYASSQHNTTLAAFIGSTSNFFIQLTQGARLEAEYDKSTDVLDAHFYGGFATNAFTLNAAGQTVTSDMFTFPISWLLNITLDTTDGTTQTSSIYFMMQEYKLLPGAVFTIKEGVTLNIIKLNVYETFNDELATGRYPANKAAARLNVDGVIIAGQLGGKVYTSNVNGVAKVKATSLPYAITYEIISVSGSSILASAKGKDMRFDLELYSYDGTLLDKTMYQGIEYYTDGGIWQTPDYFELVVGEGYSVTVTEWWIKDSSGNLTKQTNSNGQTFTTGQTIYLSTAGSHIVYTLNSTEYVIFKDGMSASYSDRGKGYDSSTDGVIYSALLVKKVPIVTINSSVSLSSSSITLYDANADGYCEAEVFVQTKWVWKTYKYNAAAKYKVNINSETDDENNIVYHAPTDLYTSETLELIYKNTVKYREYKSSIIYAIDGVINVYIVAA